MKIVNAVQTCLACPSQWDAETDDGKSVYIRYRWGTLWVRVQTEKLAVENDTVTDWPVVLQKQIGDSYDGLITLEEIIPLLEEIAL